MKTAERWEEVHTGLEEGQWAVAYHSALEHTRPLSQDYGFFFFLDVVLIVIGLP